MLPWASPTSPTAAFVFSLAPTLNPDCMPLTLKVRVTFAHVAFVIWIWTLASGGGVMSAAMVPVSFSWRSGSVVPHDWLVPVSAVVPVNFVRSQMLTVPMPACDARVDGHWTSNVTLVASVCMSIVAHPPSALASSSSAASVEPPPLVLEVPPLEPELPLVLAVPPLEPELPPLPELPSLAPELPLPELDPPPSSPLPTTLLLGELQRTAPPTTHASARPWDTNNRR